jgi:hypothetical protein
MLQPGVVLLPCILFFIVGILLGTVPVRFCLNEIKSHASIYFIIALCIFAAGAVGCGHAIMQDQFMFLAGWLALVGAPLGFIAACMKSE